MTTQEHTELPPKTCSVDRLITVPEDIEKVLAGSKSATRRNGRYADVDELMILQGTTFRITRVYAQTLGELTEQNAREEGFTSLEAYRDGILSFHPGMPWLPHMRVWVHEFELHQES